jgi:hypothetical protein
MAKTPRLRGPTRTRADGRKSLLVYLHPDLIKDLKKAALDEDRTAYEITEEAVAAWLAARKVGGKSIGE